MNADAREERLPRSWVAGILAAAVLLAVLVGYPVQRHYLQNRYRDPSFTAPGLDAAFAWARNVSDSRIATTSTRQYPLFGTDLSNHVAYIGVEAAARGYEEAPNCRAVPPLHRRRGLRLRGRHPGPGRSGEARLPPQAKWTEGPNAEVVLKKKPTVVFRITGPLDPSTCP